jgi:hypothetical protein
MSLSKMPATAAALVGIAFAGSCASATEVLTNGSFEATAIGDGQYVYPEATIDGWTYTGAALVGAVGRNDWYADSLPLGQDGARFVALQDTATLSQAFVSTGSAAILTWVAAGRPYFGGYNGDQTYTVLIDSVEVGTYSTVSGEAFGAHTVTLAGLSAGTHVLTFAGQVGSDESAFLDKVSIDAVPEPASWMMMVAAFGMVGAMVRRRRALVVTA